MTPCNNTSIAAVNCTNQTSLMPQLTPTCDILNIIFGSLSILLNGFLLLVIFVERKKLFVSRISYLVANLALADFLIGLVLVFIIQPIKIEEKTETIINLELPFIWAAMFISFLTLFLMSAERFVVLALPMLWLKILTTRRTIFAICIVWCLAIISGAFVHLHRYETFFALTVTMELSVLFFIGIHIYIFRFLKTRTHSRAELDDEERTEVSPWPTPEISDHVLTKKHKEVTTVVAILLFVLIFTIIPHFICLQIFLAGQVINATIYDNLNTKKFFLAYNYTETFSYFNFVINPIVYAWRLKMYRRAFLNVFRSSFQICHNLFK